MTNTAVKITKPRRINKKLLALVILVIIIVLAALELTGITHIIRKETPATKIVKVAGTPTKSPINNSSAGQSSQNAEKTPTSSSSSGDGRIIDTHGQSGTNTPSSQWIVSTSGNITVKQPTANAKIQNGGSVSGSAKVKEVHYRLIDNKTGVIAQGQLGVINGNFSGTLQFTPTSSSGRLDVFSIDSGGTEINEVQISVGL